MIFIVKFSSEISARHCNFGVTGFSVVLGNAGIIAKKLMKLSKFVCTFSENS